VKPVVKTPAACSTRWRSGWSGSRWTPCCTL